MTVLISGGTGFVGQWMGRTSHQDAVFLSSKDYHHTNWFLHKYSAIVHLAPIAPDEVIDYCLRNNTRLLYCSSGAAYDLQTEYAANKRRWENQCLNSGIDVVIARLFTFYGEGLDSGKAISQFEKCAKNNEPIIITGTGKAVRTYLHGYAMARELWAILKDGLSREIYDIGSDVEITIGQLALDIVKLYGSSSKIIIQGNPDPVPYYVPKNLQKTKDLL
jgi:nucleoside-diphosphate-sugar epimerase